MVRSAFPIEHLAELLALAGAFFRKNGYPDAWLFDVASESIVRGDDTLARACLAAFEKHRTLYGLEAEIVTSLWRLVEREPVLVGQDIAELVEGSVVNRTERNAPQVRRAGARTQMRSLALVSR